MKAQLSFVTLMAAAAAFADPADPQVSNVQVSQDPASRRVTVTYNLDEDAIVTMDVLTNGVSIGGANINHVAGDCFKLVTGDATNPKTLTWRPNKSWPDQRFNTPVVSVKITAWAKDCPPDYMVCDLRDGSLFYYENEAQLPEGIGSDLYRTYQLVMRRIHAANVTWTMGSPSDEKGREKCPDTYVGWTGYGRETAHKVTLTQDYYMGVFEITTRQFGLIYGKTFCRFTNPDDYDTRPVDTITDGTRTVLIGNANLGPANDNYESTIDSTPACYLYKMRAKFGNAIKFNLPTEAQWEFACRAGTETALYSGKSLTNDEASDDELNKLARNKYNCKSTDLDVAAVDGGTARVGSYLPNAWGLYDMLGNVAEMCADRFVKNGDYGSAAVTDPKGSATGEAYSVRGGTWCFEPYVCRSAARAPSADAGSGWGFVGCRLVAPIE